MDAIPRNQEFEDLAGKPLTGEPIDYLFKVAIYEDVSLVIDNNDNINRINIKINNLYRKVKLFGEIHDLTSSEMKQLFDMFLRENPKYNDKLLGKGYELKINKYSFEVNGGKKRKTTRNKKNKRKSRKLRRKSKRSN